MHYVGVNRACDDAGVGSAKKNGLGTGVVVGIVVGAVAVASALAALLTFLLLRRRSKYSNRNNSKLYGEECSYTCASIHT